jgi:hypothetical protein
MWSEGVELRLRVLGDMMHKGPASLSTALVQLIMLRVEDLAAHQNLTPNQAAIARLDDN